MSEQCQNPEETRKSRNTLRRVLGILANKLMPSSNESKSLEEDRQNFAAEKRPVSELRKLVRIASEAYEREQTDSSSQTEVAKLNIQSDPAAIRSTFQKYAVGRALAQDGLLLRHLDWIDSLGLKGPEEVVDNMVYYSIKGMLNTAKHTWGERTVFGSNAKQGILEARNTLAERLHTASMQSEENSAID